MTDREKLQIIVLWVQRLDNTAAWERFDSEGEAMFCYENLLRAINDAPALSWEEFLDGEDE